MPTDLSWLPDRHLPVAATLAHADELLARLTDVLYDYSTQAEGTIALREVPHGQVSRTTITAVAPLPRAIPLYTADVLTTLRAAVEHCLYAEVEEAHRGPLTPVEARSIEMPAADTAENFDRWVAGRKRRAPKPLQLGSPLLARMRLLQPYQRPKSPQEHPMALLAGHSNLAKHRMPAVAALRLAAIRPDNGRIDPRVRIPDPVEGPVKVGDVLAETPLGAFVPVSLYPTVGLNRPGTEQWPVLVKELEYLASWVRTQAIPLLVIGTADVDPLPARYDTTIGHEDERGAIGEGTEVAAGVRYTRRLSAAVARLNLHEVIDAHPDKPNPEPFDRWLASLDDVAVLERVASLAPGHTLAHALRNKDVLDNMLAEARAFDGLQRPAT